MADVGLLSSERQRKKSSCDSRYTYSGDIYVNLLPGAALYYSRYVHGCILIVLCYDYYIASKLQQKVIWATGGSRPSTSKAAIFRLFVPHGGRAW